jgi:hypothetical protein
MAQLTRSNIAYDLSISPHRLTVPYGESSLTYVFSSDLYRRKFIEKHNDNREHISNSLTKRFGFTVRQPILADIKLYTTIEKRGFLLVKNGVEVQCPDEIILDGERVTLRNSDD